ncbi:angiopoietin-related protein 7-like isoform X2 [Sycon ciliatum]
MAKWLQVFDPRVSQGRIQDIEQFLATYMGETVDEMHASTTNLGTIALILGGDNRAQLFLQCIQKRLPRCAQNAPCHYDGQCVHKPNGVGTYRCSCQEGYSGTFCEKPQGCAGNPCLNGATCIQKTIAEYVCVCPSFYEGAHCETQWFSHAVLDRLWKGIRELTASLRQQSQVHESSRGALVRINGDVNSLRGSLVSKVENVQKEFRETKDGLLYRISGLASSQRVLEYVNRLQNKVDGFQGCYRIDHSRGVGSSRVYTVRSKPLFDAYCDMATSDGGGWTVIQRRKGGALNFSRSWEEYKHGFGELLGDFWLGNDKIHRLTTGQEVDLRMEVHGQLEHKGSVEKHHLTFSGFRMAGEEDNYRLHIGPYLTGTIRHSGIDALMAYHNNSQFSTYDRDHDLSSKNCAAVFRGGWWYNACKRFDLNEENINVKLLTLYAHRKDYNQFDHAVGDVVFAEMKIRPQQK